MKIGTRTIRYGIAAVGIVIFVGALGAGNANAQSKKEILDRMDMNYKSLSSLRSDVTMVKYDPVLETSDVTQGTTNFLPKTAKRVMYVRIDWTKPLNESIVVIGDDYKMYRPALKQVIIGKANSGKNGKIPANALAFLSMSKAQLMANYDVSVVGEENLKDGTRTAHILLTPKVTTSYKSADLWIDVNGMPRQAKVTEKNDDTSTILLTNIQKNVTILAKSFTLDYPKGTKEIKG